MVCNQFFMIRNSTNRFFLIISDGCAFQQFIDEGIEDDQNEDIEG
jgi:hypothetical protein